MKYQKNGYYELVVYVDVRFVKYAEEQDAMIEGFGAADYIQGVLNTALARDMQITEQIKLIPPTILPDFEDNDPDARP